MSLSFEESIKKSAAAATPSLAVESEVAVAATMNVDDLEVEDYSIMTLDESYGIAAYAGDDGNWTQDTRYLYYSVFSDDNISTVSDTKDIILDGKQFNITQEENSQYIPFEMPRYYDGYDLTKATLSVHYQTKNGYHGHSEPVNVTYNNNKIRFGWLVDAGATIDAGTLKFEIQAYGQIRDNNNNLKSYVWKTGL